MSTTKKILLVDDDEDLREALGEQVDLDRLPLAALNTAFANDGVAIRATGPAPKPIHLIYLHEADTSDAILHHVIKLDPGADVTILENGPAAARFNKVMEIEIGDGEGDAGHVDAGPDAVQSGQLARGEANPAQEGARLLERGDGLWDGLEKVGLRPDRLQLEWCSAAEGGRWQTIMTEIEKKRAGVTAQEVEKSREILAQA